MNLPSFVLARLPCSCAVEREQHIHTQRGLIECPWCLAVFVRSELEEWFAGGPDPVPFAIAKPMVLVKVGERLLQVTGVCGDCQVLLAREGPGAASLHLRVPAEEIVFLEN